MLVFDNDYHYIKPETMVYDSQLIPIIEILEGLESLMDQVPSSDIEEILLAAWLKVSNTLPEDFLAATREDASAAVLRRYLRVKAFFDDPIKHPISPQELNDYYQNHLPIDEEQAEFFFLDLTDD
ncbi:MAG: hypothetical protein AAF652_03520 [Cyanobacteria bacterium P01_C01_bin.72]